MELIKTSKYFTYEQIQIANSFIKNGYCTSCNNKNTNLLQIRTKKIYYNRKYKTVIMALCEDCIIYNAKQPNEYDIFTPLNKELKVIGKKIEYKNKICKLIQTHL